MKKDKTTVFIEKAIRVHGNKYNYSATKYSRAKDNVDIFCPSCNKVFTQQASVHLRGNGCSRCHINKIRKNADAFLAKCKEKHNDFYDYSTTDFTGVRNPMQVICPIHGAFSITAQSHIDGKICPACTEARKAEITESLLARAKAVHDDKYTYSEISSNINKAIPILCTVHKTYFRQNMKNHLSGSGCPTCKSYGEVTPTEWFLSKALDKFPDRAYDYSQVELVSKREKVKIVCDKHGQWEATPEKFFRSKGCPSCAMEGTRSDTTHFITKARKVHGDKYDYSKVNYFNVQTPVKVICPAHGEWLHKPDYHLNGKGCPSCGKMLSKTEDSIKVWLEQTGLIVSQSDRKLIKPYELDLVIPDKRIAIEYNGVRWHTEKFGKDKHYHKNKTDMCNEAGYRLIHIWEDDYLANPEKELKFLTHALGVSDTKPVFARKTVLKEIDGVVAKPFLDEHHIQGTVSSSVYLGHFHEDELVAVTTFTFKNKKSYAELTRHTTKGGVLGSLGKATKWFSKTYKVNIISFCDLSRFDGKSYVAAGFEKIGLIAPDYKYVVGNKREHKFGWRKKSIQTKLPEIYDESLTEKQMMDLADIPRVWDCGKIKFEYKYKGESK